MSKGVIRATYSFTERRSPTLSGKHVMSNMHRKHNLNSYVVRPSLMPCVLVHRGNVYYVVTCCMRHIIFQSIMRTFTAFLSFLLSTPTNSPVCSVSPTTRNPRRPFPSSFLSLLHPHRRCSYSRPAKHTRRS